MKRREFIELSGKSIGGLVIYSLAGEPIVLNAQENTVKVPLRFFTEHEAKVIVAACERIFPADESGPGATQAAAMIYIDRQLAGPYGTDKYRYTQPPFVESIPEHGYQGKENPQETYRAGIQRLGKISASWTVHTKMNGCRQSRRPTSSNCCASTQSREYCAIRCTEATRE